MTSNEAWRRYLEMGAAVGEVTIARADEIARGLLSSSEDERERALREVNDLVRFGTRVGEQLFELAKDQLTNEVRARSADSLDWLLDRLGQVLTAPPEADAAASAADERSSLSAPAHGPRVLDVEVRPPDEHPAPSAAPTTPVETATTGQERRTKQKKRTEPKQGPSEKSAPKNKTTKSSERRPRDDRDEDKPDKDKKAKKNQDTKNRDKRKRASKTATRSAAGGASPRSTEVPYLLALATAPPSPPPR